MNRPVMTGIAPSLGVLRVTDPNYTAVCLLADRSGSMWQIRDDAEGAINAFITSQREKTEPGQRRTLRLVQFDHRIEVVHESTSFADVPDYKLVPEGRTALLDAMGMQITAFGAELAALPEDKRPGHVVFAVMTDGMENASREYVSWSAIKEMVERQRNEWAWNVVYLGANQDAVQVGGQLGVHANSAITYRASAGGTRSAAASLDSYVVAAASGAVAAFSDEDREAAQQD